MSKHHLSIAAAGASDSFASRLGKGADVGLGALCLLMFSIGALAAEPASKDAMPAVKAPAATAPAVSPPQSSPGDRGRKPESNPAKRAGSDRLNLDTSVVTGNRELPKVLYIVPWKRSELGDLPTQPMNTLLDEVLTPVDRDVFRREVTYYGAMSATDAASKTAPGTPPAGSEK